MFAYIRLGFTLLWILFMFSFRMIGLLFLPFSPRIDEWFRRVVFVNCSKGIMACMGVRLRVEGTPPKAPFYLITNHISLVDIFVIASQLGCVFVSKAELGDWPVGGFITRRMKTIYINRSSKRDTRRVNQEITDVMQSGLGVVAFPESTTTQDGYMLPFKPALLQSAIDLEMPVHVASLWYGTPENPQRGIEKILWKDGTTALGNFINIAGVGGCECRLVFSEETVSAPERRELAQKAQEAVARIHTPIA